MEILRLCWVFLKIGAVSFGGGWTIVGLLRDEVASAGIMTPEAFQRAVAIAQITPGPVALNVATLSGWDAGGWVGAAAVTLSVLAVPLLLLILASLLARRIALKKEALAEALAVGALCMTLMTAANLLLGAGPDIRFFVIAALSFLVSAFTKLHPALLIIGCGAFSMAWEGIAAFLKG